MTKKELYDIVYPKYCEWMRDAYLDNPNRKTIHPHEYVNKIIDIVIKEQSNQVKLSEKKDKFY